MNQEDKVIENLERCPSFKRCNQNLCPLDLEFSERTGGESDKCKWLKEESRGNIAGKEIVFGGKQMPDNILRFVPSKNVKHLNQISRKRWQKLNPELNPES